MQHFLALIDVTHTARDGTALGKYGIEKLGTQSRQFVLHLDDERLCLRLRLRICRGKSCEFRLAVHDAIACILQIEDTAAVLLQNVQRRAAEIRRAVRRQFLTDCVQRVAARIRKDTCRHAAVHALEDVLKTLTVAKRLAVIERTQPAMGQHHEDVTHGIVEEMKDLALLMIDDVHVISPFACSLFHASPPHFNFLPRETLSSHAQPQYWQARHSPSRHPRSFSA